MDFHEEATLLVTELFNSSYSLFIRYALQSTHRLTLAEDIVQEALMLLYKDVRLGKRIDNPKAWTFCVVRRLISKEVKTSRREESVHEFLSMMDQPSANLMDIEADFEADHVTQLLSILTPREQEVILLRMAALKYREIGDRLGISPKSVNTFLTRALRKLQKAAGQKHKGRESEYVESINPKTLS